MTIIITILGWFTLIFFLSMILAIAGKMIFDAAAADYKSYQHLRIFRKRLLRKRYEDYARLLFLLNKDTEVFRLKNDTKDWNFEDWMVYYTNKAKEIK